MFPLGNGGKGGLVEGEGTIGGAHHAAGGGEGWLGAGGNGEEQQAIAIVDGGRSVGSRTGVGVEGDLRLVAIGGEELGDGSLPGG